MKDKNDRPIDAGEPIGQPPFFKSWSGMYWLVLGNLAFLIMLFYFLTNAYA